MVDDPPIGGGGGVVEFVDDDVIKGPRIEPGQMRISRESLDRGEDDVSLGVLFLT